MNVKKVVGFLVLALLVIWVFNDPGGAGSTFRNGLGLLVDAGESAGRFFSTVFGGRSEAVGMRLPV